MRQIDAIHTLEDERFLVRMARMSVAVLLAGVGFAILWFAVSNSPLPICPLELNVALGPLGAAITGEPAASGWSVAGWWFALGAGCVVSFAAHELVHGFVFGRFMPAGHKVTYGGNLKKGILYASAEGVLFTRDQYLLVAAAPTIVITSLVAAAGWGFSWPLWTIAVASIHLSGCTGDWGYLRAILRNPDIAYCEDTAWGVAFYSDMPEQGVQRVRMNGFEVVEGGGLAGKGKEIHD